MVGWALSVLKHLPSKNPVTAETTAFYALGLEDVPDEALRAAVKRAAQECTFLPTPAELRTLAGANRAPVIDTEALLSRIQGFSDYHPARGTSAPRVESVRDLFGPATGEAYGMAGGGASLYSGNETTRSIARREFARALTEAVAVHGMPTKPRLALPSANEGAVVYDDEPRLNAGGFRRLGSG